MKFLIRIALLLASLFCYCKQLLLRIKALILRLDTIRIISASDSGVLQAGGTTTTLIPNGFVFIRPQATVISIDGREGNGSIKRATVAIQFIKDINLSSAKNININSYQDVDTEGLNLNLTAKLSTTLKSAASTTIANTVQTSITSAVILLN